MQVRLQMCFHLQLSLKGLPSISANSIRPIIAPLKNLLGYKPHQKDNHRGAQE